jgi:hypothetical protein
MVELVRISNDGQLLEIIDVPDTYHVEPCSAEER